MEWVCMRQIIAKILVLCLLVITMHAASGGSHEAVAETAVTAQTQSVNLVSADNGQLPTDDQQAVSDCSICHGAHVLLLLAQDGFSFNLYTGRATNTGGSTLHPSPLDDIPHPPIILI